MMRSVLVGILLAIVSQAIAQVNNDSLIQVLRSELGQREVYVEKKRDRIENLMEELTQIQKKNTRQQFDLYNELYHEYKTFIYDSAFRYSSKLIETAYQLNDKSLIGYSRVKLGFILISSGMYNETFDSLNVVEVKYLTDSTRLDYYRLFCRAYADLALYNNDQYYSDKYERLDSLYLDSALQYCTRGSYQYYYFSEFKNLHWKNYEMTVKLIDTLVRTQKLSHAQLAVNYYDAGTAYRMMDDKQNAIRYTILASLCDIKAATKETAALHTLAWNLYEQGATENAYLFVKEALHDAEFYGARQRKIEISSMLPVIASAQLSSVDEQRKVWFNYSAGLTVLAILIVGFSIIIVRQLRKLKAAESVIRDANSNLQEINHKLLEADKIKEEYIGYYFSNNSNYIDKIESFRNSIDQKLQNRKVDDIKVLVNTINPHHEREELYFNFDKIFLKLFPDFVTIFNSYFDPEDRIVLKEGQLLNTELRIFALIRLGIHDAEKIARILGYSVNTIYAYKNRIKNKSRIANDIFERKIMEINSVSTASH